MTLEQQLANRELEVQHVLGKVVLVEQQLAAALAACKLKDEALEYYANPTSDTFPNTARKALNTQPDDSAHGRIEELKAALEIAKKGLRHYENRNAAHGTRNPAAIALDDIAATLKGLK